MFCEVWFAGLGRYLRKKWSKRGTISWERLWNLFVFKTMILTTQNGRAKLASFSSYNMWLFFEGHDTTESEHDVQNSWKWWMFVLCENAQFCFENLQNAWIHSLNRFTCEWHSAFRVSQKCFAQIRVWWIYWSTTLWHPKILTQNFTFRKQCWKFVDQN